MSNPKLSVYVSGITPNPAKVIILLEELGISYITVQKEFGDGLKGVKAPDFLKINPNGRVPAIIDHANGNKIVWESAAILYYLSEKYDASGKYSGTNLDEKTEVMQWLVFQVSGMGPMQGQLNYFKHRHPVKGLHHSVYDRFRDESYHVWRVLEERLKDRQWLALDRFTIADIAVYTWLRVAHVGELDFKGFPKLKAYFDKISEFSSVKVTYARLSV
ncbi:hypothetical protein Clacol_003428 [Clathrus columnatus]|uniref:Glutathione S-transferase n=1 Tax=Clathrus columnatus TaxID=1419009 RepID=A0AAV5A864_9AGAM|nr:hypothetical protein Clacol_003428 [Clathrus columnatus]